MSASNAGQAGKAELFCSSAQVGEWLKPADCKSAPPRRYEGSNPSLCTRDLNESSLHGAGRLRRPGSAVVGDFERSEITLRHTRGPGHVRVKDLAAAQRCDASGPREWGGLSSRAADGFAVD